MPRSLYEPELLLRIINKKKRQLAEIEGDLQRLPLDHPTRPRWLERMLQLQQGIPALEAEYARLVNQTRSRDSSVPRRGNTADLEDPEGHSGRWVFSRAQNSTPPSSPAPQSVIPTVTSSQEVPQPQISGATTANKEIAAGGSVKTGKTEMAEPAKRGLGGAAQSSSPAAATWDAIEIQFISDERVQIRNGTTLQTLNYAEFGFADRRDGKPNQAWVLLRTLAEKRGVLHNAADARQVWAKVEKRIQEIRRVLRAHFGISADPIPFIEGAGYRANFKLDCGPSYET